MNKQELQNEINKTKEHLANMEKMLAECKYERWKPKQEDLYWFVNSYLNVIDDSWVSTSDQRDLYNAYNFFRTKEQAEAEAEKILVRRMLEDIAKRLNKGKKIIWEDDNQDKYYIWFDTLQNIIREMEGYRYKIQGVVYCLDRNFRDVAIREIGEERLKKYLRGE